MTTELLDDGPLLLTSFYGRERRGMCMQFTINGVQPPASSSSGWSSLTLDEVKKLHAALGMWLADNDRPEPR